MLREVLTSLGLLASPMTEPAKVADTNLRMLERFEYLKANNPTVKWVSEQLTLKMNVQRLPSYQHTPILSVHTNTHCQLVLNSEAHAHKKYDYFLTDGQTLTPAYMDFIIGHEIGHCVLHARLTADFNFYRADYMVIAPWKDTPGNQFASQYSQDTVKLHAEVFSDKFGLFLVQTEHPEDSQTVRDRVLTIRQDSGSAYGDWETFRFIDRTQPSHAIQSSQASTH